MNTTTLLNLTRDAYEAKLDALEIALDYDHPAKRLARTEVNELEKSIALRTFKLFGHDFDEYYANLVDNILFGEAS